MHPRRLVLAFVPLFLAACEESSAPDPDPYAVPAAFYGEWLALRTCGGMTGGCLMGGGGRLIVQHPDSLFAVDSAGVSILERRFRVREGEPSRYGNGDDVDLWTDGEWQYWMRIRKLTADSLWLSDNHADGYTTELLRLE